jgi:bacterial/archaeal transporter family-2 protein
MIADPLRHGAIMLMAGVGIPVLAALNAQLGARIGSPVAATVVLFGVALSVTIALATATGSFGAVRAVAQQPYFLLLSGVLIAFYVLSVTYVAPRFGLGNAILFVLIGQILSSALIDHFGLLGSISHPLSWIRATGIALMVVGITIVQRH